MEVKKEKVLKRPIFVVVPKDRKIAIGELSVSPTDNEVKLITVMPRKNSNKKFTKSKYNNEYLEFKIKIK